MADYPWFDVDVARGLVEQAADGVLHGYPEGAHLFADSGLPDFDGAAAALMTERAMAFFARW